MVGLATCHTIATSEYTRGRELTPSRDAHTYAEYCALQFSDVRSCGAVMVAPPREPVSVAAARSTPSGFHMTHRWQTFRGAERGDGKLTELGPSALPAQPDEPWQLDIHKAFPCCTSSKLRDGQRQRFRYNDKEAHHLQRSSERWATKLARRAAQQG